MDTGARARSGPWLAVGAEIAEAVSRIEAAEFRTVLAEFSDPARRWFFSGQGRSGLVAAMVAMRFMHLGRTAHVQGEATAPSIRQGDGILFVSGSGETPVTLHFARVARDEGARIVLVTHEPDSTLAGLAHAVLSIPVESTIQFGGSLFEQAALVALDSVVYAVGAESSVPYQRMAFAHTNLK